VDNYVDLDLRALKQFHEEKESIRDCRRCIAEMNVSQSGMIELDADKRIKRFIEKPAPTERTQLG